MENLYDYEILELAMKNTYDLLTGDANIQGLLDEGIDSMPFACDPSNPPSKQDMENLLNYYVGEEEFEKCSVIQKHIKSFTENLAK